MTVLREDIAAFDEMQTELARDHDKAWVLFHKGRFQGAYAAFDDAAAMAIERFGTGPYLIRQVGAPRSVQLPGGMIFTPSHALDAGRL
ncbi:MAG: hypothetical protein GC145_15335 [Caulobacter sp.]|nr:hypothetical protein [Caulobacter sp.]